MPNFSTTHPFLTKNMILPIYMLNVPIFWPKKMKSSCFAPNEVGKSGSMEVLQLFLLIKYMIF